MMIMPRVVHLKRKLHHITITFHRESKMFTETCPRCIKKLCYKRLVAGIKNILTEGFVMCSRVDIVDLESMPNRDFKFLLNYIDHCVKKLTIPLVSKQVLNVALALLQIFTEQGPPAIPQVDNSREFSRSAMDTSNKRLYLSDEVRSIATSVTLLLR